MKKVFVIVCFCIAFCVVWNQPCLANEMKVTVQNTEFPLEINGVDVNRANEQYPIISYHDVLYLPLTYNMKCYTGIKTFYCDTDYVKNVRFIGLDEIIDTAYTGYPIKKDIKRKLQATVPDCRIAINSNEETEFIKNTSMKYPILKYRDVLYLPLTWDIISNRLGWKCNFSEKTGLVLDTTRRTKPIVDLHHFANGPSRWIWSMSYCIAPDGWVGYPDNTLEHNYQFKTYLNGQKEVAFSLEEDLQDAVYTMNRMMVTTEQAEISKIKPKIEDGIFTIHCVRSVEGDVPQTCRLKINLENQQVIEKVQVDSVEETV